MASWGHNLSEELVSFWVRTRRQRERESKQERELKGKWGWPFPSITLETFHVIMCMCI